MPSIGEQGWGELVSNNFEILDTISNTFNTQINTINENLTTLNLATASGTRILSISSLPIVNSENFSNYASYDENNVYIASFCGNITFESITQPPHSCRLMIISVNGNATISGNIDTYPTTLQSETPPGTPETNTYTNTITFTEISPITLTYAANANNSQITMEYGDYLNFISNTNIYTKRYSLSIPAATAAQGVGNQNGTAGTATNTCNGGGGSCIYNSKRFVGGTGCIFGQYTGGDYHNRNDTYAYGYGSSASNKYRCGLVIIVNGNLTINSTITQNGGNGNYLVGGYGGGGCRSGGGGAPVFIYYTGTYTNNGTINTNGGSGYGDDGYNGGAGGIKVTKITL